MDGLEIGKSHYDSDYWGYSFEMPDRDVTVTARFYTKAEIWGTEREDLAALKEKFPAYFGLSASKGLEVYVWEIVPEHYSCGLLPGTNREKTPEELMGLEAATIDEMRAILSTYDIAKEDVFVIPWQNPVSSHIPEFWIVWEDETPAETEKRRQAYVDRLRDLLLGDGESEEEKN